MEQITDSHSPSCGMGRNRRAWRLPRNRTLVLMTSNRKKPEVLAFQVVEPVEQELSSLFAVLVLWLEDSS